MRDAVAAVLMFAGVAVQALCCVGVCALAGVVDGVIALELASVLTTTALVALSEGLRRQPFVDLALVFALLSFVGSLAFVRLLERRA